MSPDFAENPYKEGDLHMNASAHLTLLEAVRSPDHLTTTLSEYGLCPEEWVVINKGRKIYTIQNIQQPEFFFKGIIKFENGRRKWHSICLAGL